MKTETIEDRLFIILVSITFAVVAGYLVAYINGDNTLEMLTLVVTAPFLAVVLAQRN